MPTAGLGYAAAMRGRTSALALILLLPSFLHGQKSESDLRQRLLSKQLYLRGTWRDDKLAFDASGHLIGASRLISWTLSGVRLTEVKLASDHLILSGFRVGVKFVSHLPQRVDLKKAGDVLLSLGPEEMFIEIQSPPGGDYSQALHAIFVDDLSDLVPSMPPYWQDFARKHLLQSITSSSEQPPPPHKTEDRATSAAPSNTATQTPPVPIKLYEPQFSDAARALGYGGSSLVSVEVDETGKPNHPGVVEPIGLGLDEQALWAVSHYEFKPATRDGDAIRMKVNCSVNFQFIITKM